LNKTKEVIWVGQGGAFAPPPVLKNSGFWGFCTQFFSYFATPPLSRKSAKMLPTPGKN